MDYKQIIKDIEAKKLKPIYLLHGEESYFIDKITLALENILTEDEKAFNQTVVYGKDSEVTDIANMCQRFPMMAPYQLIIVKEAQYLKDIDALKHYVDNPVPTTILVLIHKEKSVDKRKSVFKKIAKVGLSFESKKMYDSQIPAVLTQMVETKGKRIDIKSSHLMLEFIGNNLNALEKAVNKLMVNLSDSEKQITPELIEKYIGYSKDFNVFELQKAIGNKEILKANRIIDYFEKNPKHSINEVIPSLFHYFQNVFKIHYLKSKTKESVASCLRINPYFSNEYIKVAGQYNIRKTVKAIEILKEYDLKSKGIGYAGRSADVLLKEMVFKILNL